MSAVERSLAEIDFGALTSGRTYHPSPAAWEDEVLYFLFVDRFSDGKEFGGFGDADAGPGAGPTNARTTPRFDLDRDAGTADRETWFAAGRGVVTSAAGVHSVSA